jgi:hypothetical protein
MPFDVRPHVVAFPVDQQIKFRQSVIFVPAFQLEDFSCRRLLAPEPCDPTFFAGQCPAKRLHLPDAAALLPLRDALVEGVWAVLLNPALNG